MTCLRHHFDNDNLACLDCRYAENNKCTYGTPVCKHDIRIKCRHEETET